MTPSIALLVLLSAALHPIWNVLIKRASSAPAAFVGLAATQVAVSAALIPINGGGFLPPAEVWHLLALSAVGQTVYGVALVAALQRGDLSSCYPIIRASPLAIVAWGWLGEGRAYGPVMLAGILLVLVGGFLVQTVPGRRIADPKALAAAVLALLGAAVYSVADGHAMRVIRPEALLFWAELVSLPLLVVGFRLIGERVPLVPRRPPWRALAAGVISYASYYLILLAYEMGAEVAAVASVRQASIPLSVLIGALWLGEGRLGGRLAASLLVAGGIILIVLNR